MGKKNKGDAVPSVSSVANRDMLQRLNFLYQASAYLTAVAGPSESSHSTDLPARKRRKQYATVHDLSRAYLEDAKLVAQKTTVRMDPSVKRTICKKCNALLVPGVSCRVRVKKSSSHRHSVSYVCMHCQTARRIPAPPIGELAPVEAQPSTAAAPVEARSSPVADVDLSAAPPAEANTESKPRRRRRPRSFKVPHFQREGHVVFRGNQQLVADSTDQDSPSMTT